MRYGIWKGLPQISNGVRKWDYGRARAPRAVFIHRMDGNLPGTDSWFRARQSGTVSTHFGIGYANWADRLIGRVSTWQWVDTANTAYGTAVTRNPVSSLARSVLGDLIGRIDVNHAIIHIEVEGFSWQPWPAGFVTALNKLLAALRAHGPLYVMRHNDVSSKVCPGTTVPWSKIVPSYGQRLGYVAPTTQYVKFNAGVNGVNMRTAPDSRYRNVYAIAYSDADPKPNGIIRQPAYGGGTTKWIGNTGARRTLYATVRGPDGHMYYRIRMKGTNRNQYIQTRFMHRV